METPAFMPGRTSIVPGDIVLDPMMGSGTAVVEALLEGRRGIGLDIDPLALRSSRVKTMPLNVESLQHAGLKVISQAHAFLSQKTIGENLIHRFDERTRAFIDYWFLPATQHELMALVLAIQSVTDTSARRFLELTFSSVIITKSGGVSRARDLAHSRPHLDTTKVPKNALEQFSVRLQKNLNSIARLGVESAVATTLAGDARSIPLADGVVDLIVTSPPYANAIDYMRAHKFSLVWLGKSVTHLSELRAEYIGSERVKGAPLGVMPERPESIIQQLKELDDSKAGVLRKYFTEMQSVLGEMYRVLRSDSAAIVTRLPAQRAGLLPGRWAPQTSACSETTCPSSEEGTSIGGGIPQAP